jgi:threonine dehydrogenase-like Zn-dependent dehydrogenase
VHSVSPGDLLAAPTPHIRYAAISSTAVTRVTDNRVGIESLRFVTFAQIVMIAVRRTKVQWGDAVVVFGLGILGQLTARFCRISGRSQKPSPAVRGYNCY